MSAPRVRYYRVVPDFLGSGERAALAALAAAPGAAWEGGRQGGGYAKLALPPGGPAPAWLEALTARTLRALGPLPDAGAPFAMAGWDRYVLRYGPGASVPSHTDPPLASGLSHLRLNAVVRACARGGVLVLDGERVALAEGDAVLFRPDAASHEVTPIEEGERLVWSVGCNY